MFCQLLKIMTVAMKILLFILFASTATSLAHRRDPSVNHDITILLNDSIARTFQNSNSSAIEDLMFELYNPNPINHYMEFDYNLEPFQNKFYFTNVHITVDFVSKSIPIRHEFSSFKTAIFIPKFQYVIRGYLGATNDTVHALFLCFVGFKNVSITAFKLSPHGPVESKLYFNMKYEEYFECEFLELKWTRRNITSETRFKLKKLIKKAVPLLFIENLQHNEEFSRSFDKQLSNNLEKEIASLYPDFQNNSESYHYFIPNITSLKRTLSNINITGLWNFHSLSINLHFDQIVRNLTIKHIRGHANLSYDSQNSKIFPLRFEAEFVSIMVDEEMQRVSVTAYNYSVSQIDLNSSLTEHQSKWVMEGIELAIASSIMPSIKFYRNWNVSSNTQENHPIVKMSTTMSQLFQANTVEKLYHNLSICLSEETTVESNLQLGSSNYTISINYTSTPIYLDIIGCALYSNFKMTSRVPWSVHGTTRVSNTTHQFDEFLLSSQNVFFELIIQFNNFSETYDYDLKFDPYFQNEDELRLHEQKHFTEGLVSDIIEKAGQMLSSSIYKKIKPFVDYLLSIPHLDYCTTPINMFDDFLPFFADHELPYYVRDTTAMLTNPFFTSKINNVKISEWTKTPTTWIYCYTDADEKILSQVYTTLENVKVQMNFNDSSFPPDELELDFFSVGIVNETNTGKIHVKFDIPDILLKNNQTLLKYEEDWLNGRLEYMIRESFKTLSNEG